MASCKLALFKLHDILRLFLWTVCNIIMLILVYVGIKFSLKVMISQVVHVQGMWFYGGGCNSICFAHNKCVPVHGIVFDCRILFLK